VGILQCHSPAYRGKKEFRITYMVMAQDFEVMSDTFDDIEICTQVCIIFAAKCITKLYNY
jgi:hypothetical protein